MFVHLPATEEQIDKDAQVRQYHHKQGPDRLTNPREVMAAENVAEDDDQEVDPDDPEEEDQERVKHLAFAKRSQHW